MWLFLWTDVVNPKLFTRSFSSPFRFTPEKKSPNSSDPYFTSHPSSFTQENADSSSPLRCSSFAGGRHFRGPRAAAILQTLARYITRALAQWRAGMLSRGAARRPADGTERCYQMGARANGHATDAAALDNWYALSLTANGIISIC